MTVPRLPSLRPAVRIITTLLIVPILLAFSTPLETMAFQVRHEPSRFDPLVIIDPSMKTGAATLPVDDLPSGDPLRSGWESFKAAHGTGWSIHLDRRSGAPLLVEGQGIPWIAGSGNSLQDASAVTVDTLERSFRTLLAASRAILLADDGELVLDRAASGRLTPEVWQVVFSRKVAGVPVMGDRYVFIIGHGNLVSFGATRWSDVRTSPVPTLDPSEALRRLYAYMGLTGTEGIDILGPADLVFLPVGLPDPAAAYSGPVGSGYGSALVWRYVLRVSGEPGTWVGQVDAHSGEIVSLADDNRYALVKGGIYPVSDDQICPDGCEQANFPMPFADITINASGQTASTMGLFNCSPGGSSARTTLAGPYVKVFDNCGSISESVSCDNDLDLKTSGGIDCTVPAGSSQGNTHASRTGFYHLNRIAEHGRAWLPGNTWLTQQLTDNVNINATCNAYWNGFSVNFYKSGGGCNNTGEIAGVFLHEWGHGLDNNDGGGYDNPTEAYADITALMTTHVSCIGRGFFQSGNCGGYGNACLNCTGIRDQDWDQRVDHTPSTPSGFVQNHCGGGDSPCGKEGHCESYIGGETIWDLANRDLPALGLDQSTSWQLTDKLWYKSRSGSGGNAYNCSLPNSDGCGSNSWFTKLRNIDDDDGNLNNGTPHAAAIFNAFNRHKIACGNSGDASNQNTSSCPSIGAPTVSGTAGSSSASLSWTSVPNAATYHVLRNDQGCSYAFTIVADVAAPVTNYTDGNLADGFTNYYRVQASGSNSACDGPVSNCIAVTPQPLAGSISFERQTYGCSTVITVKVRDANIGASTTTATVRSTTEPTPQTITLTQQSPGNPVYVGTITSTPNPPAPDGLLSLSNADTITAEYIDADDGQGGHNLLRQTTASADCIGPAVSSVASSGVTDTQASVSWTTDQASDSVLNWGPAKPPVNTTSNAALVTFHSISLTNLQQCTVYYYQVKSTDPAGNTTTDANSGQYYHFETLGNFGQGLQPCHQGRISLDNSTYSCSDAVVIKVIDIDLNQNPNVPETIAVQATSTTEPSPETVLLTETGPATSTFTGIINTDPGAAAHDGKLQVRQGDTITATYHDANDGLGPSVTYATARADCAGPKITGIAVTDLPPGRVQIAWSTEEPATSRLDWGPTTGLGKVVSDPALVTSHTLFISALDFCGPYYFKVTSADVHANVSVADRGGLHYAFETGDVPGKVFFDNFETDKGWTLTGEWQRATPQGLGNPSGRDPASAWSGGMSLGSDLTGLGANPGDYEPSSSSNATSAVINCTTLHNGQLIIHRWLNVQGQPQDAARIVVQKGVVVTPLWLNPTSGTFDGAWTSQTYDISSAADGKSNVQIVFSLVADSSIQYGGWNVDDVLIKDGSQPDSRFCGGCTNKPSFGGLTSATDLNACGDSGVTLSWQAAASWGSSGSGTYAVYRDTTPNFIPSASNRVAMGLTSLSYTDSLAPNGVTLYYLVRAENNETCSNGPNNNGVQDDNTAYLSATDSLSQPAPGDVGGTVRAAEIADTTVRLTWSPASGASSYHVYRADNPQMTGSLLLGTASSTLFEDIGEAVTQTSRYYLVRGVNACGVEGP